MNSRDDLIKWVSKDTGLPRGMVKEVLESLADYARMEVMEHGEFTLKNICMIHSSPVAARVRRDPITGRPKSMPETRRLTIKVAYRLRNAFHKAMGDGIVEEDDDLAY